MRVCAGVKEVCDGMDIVALRILAKSGAPATLLLRF